MFGKARQSFQRGQGLQSLRDLINNSRQGEILQDVPERLAYIIERYDSLDLQPKFREDVYHVISGGIDIAEALVDDVFPVEAAAAAIAKQMEVLSRALVYLQNRPSKMGFSILVTSNDMLLGSFSTKEEAEMHLEGLKGMGMVAVKGAVVVPVKILSQQGRQPRKPILPPPLEPEIMSGPLPPGITPQPTTPLHPEDLPIVPTTSTETAPNLEDRLETLEREANELPKS